MGQSYRIRTELGINKSINVELNQDFEFLEILSLKIQQADVYTRSCADYGVVVGRVTANNGLGIPNAKVSVFIPVEEQDLLDDSINTIYPYKSVDGKNEDGYRYNLLPYEKSYSKHAATGTFPSKNDVLTNQVASTIYDKYFKYTVKTNESGDYMIFGVPLGFQTLVMDVDLSDIGEFSLTPQDLIRIGRATEAQVSGNEFRTSTDLNSLPQIVRLTKVIEVSPLWGEPQICQIAINRVDFDLRDDANIDIQPTSVFMGSIYSTNDNFRLRKNCKPKDNMGNLCDLQSGPGQILAIRQTIRQDGDGNPILEEYRLEQSGNVIDEDGAWVTEVPMNLDYLTTNEFGQKVISYDPTIGIPTKAKYRFKIKWQQAKDLSQQTRRAYFLVPNVREFGWTTDSDPNYLSTTSVQGRQLNSSYYFGLDWSGYTDGITTNTDRNTKIDEIVNCEDTFYLFEYNRVYTVSGLIDQYKNGRDRGRFIGIKEIDDNSCASTVNKFPVNDGVRNFDLLFFIVSILLQVIQLIGVPIIIVLHFIAFVWNNILVPLKPLVTVFLAFQATWYLVKAIKGYVEYGIQQGAAAACFAANVGAVGLLTPACVAIQANAAAILVQANKDLISSGKWFLTLIGFKIIMSTVKERKFPPIKLSSISYPDCEACACSGSENSSSIGGSGDNSTLTVFAGFEKYYLNVQDKTVISTSPIDDREIAAVGFAQSLSTSLDSENNRNIYKVPKSTELIFPSTEATFFNYTRDLPFAERINIFNLRNNYFKEVNKISVSFDSPNNTNNHFDNTLTLITQFPFETGTLLTFVDPLLTKDVNFKYTGDSTNENTVNGIKGTPLNIGPSVYDVEYATSQLTNQVVRYNLSTGTTVNNYRFPSDIEYYQVITAITISDASKFWQDSTNSYLPNILNSSTVVIQGSKAKGALTSWNLSQYPPYKTRDLFSGFDDQYILILQRGVDPYSPKYVNKYGLGRIFGFTDENQIVVTGQTRLNIPIQKLNSGVASVQMFNNQSNIFYPSHFFRGGDGFSSFTTSTVGYYSDFDATKVSPTTQLWTRFNVNSVNVVRTQTSNGAWAELENPARYDISEDLSGGAYYYVVPSDKPSNTVITYFTSALLPSLTANPMSITSKINNVLRTDRLPSSDYLDGSSWNYNPSLLQQNIGFSIYEISADSDTLTVTGFGSGADVVTPEIEGLPASQNVFSTFECGNMTSLGCYSGNNETFGVKSKCNVDYVQNGCYVMMRRPLTDLFNGKDLRAWSEWGYRFRFFYGLCRGVLSQTFVNNWVNGSLYAFPIQVDTNFNRQNQPIISYCRDTIHFDDKTNNFYYRSSPYNNTSNRFIGKSIAGQTQPVNQRLLLYPTTIMNLGWKDSFYSEIIFEPSTNSYIMNQLNPTSYSDTSDLVNLFVVSRITDEGFLRRLTTGLNPNNNMDQLFSRPEKRIDGDLAQMMSINSEEGVIKFSPEYYTLQGGVNDPVVIYNPSSNTPAIGVFYSSTTENLQFKDFISPGRINFRATPTSNFTPFYFGIKSQEVPFYRWGLESSYEIFGTERNTWATSSSDIISRRYQSLDRTNPNDYFMAEGLQNDISMRGYIFNVSNDTVTNYSLTYKDSRPIYSTKFLVGAPFHFYFGTIVGASALDKFKQKYAIDE